MIDREAIASGIINHPELFKICGGCGGIVKKETNVCPVCKSYHFNDNPWTVMKQAAELGQRPPETIFE